MKAFQEHHGTILILRLILGVIFISAGATEIASPEAFTDSIATFRLLPDSLINLLAITLPPFEIIVGGMFVIGYQLRVAPFATIFLTVLFALALGQALARGLEVDCGCSGSDQPSAWKTWVSLARDMLLLAFAAWLYTSYKREFQKKCLA
jgi:uncharacterized membrane protein YphA (DoxX/SURF4 family)